MNWKSSILSIITSFLSGYVVAQDDATHRKGDIATSFLRDEIRKWGEIDRCYLEYEASPIPNVGSSTVKCLAMASPASIYSRTKHRDRTAPDDDDPFQLEILIRDQKVTNRYPFNRSSTTRDVRLGDGVISDLGADVALTVLPRWMVRGYRVPVDPVVAIPVTWMDALTEADYHRLPDEEVVEGQRCVVFDYRETQRLWISTDARRTLIKRELRDGKRGEVVSEVLVKSAKEVRTGLWFPNECEIRTTLPTGNRRLTKVIFSKVFLNEDVPPSLFQLESAPGEIKYQKDKGFVMVSAGGEEILDGCVAFLQKRGVPGSYFSLSRYHIALLLYGFGSGVTLYSFIYTLRQHR